MILDLDGCDVIGVTTHDFTAFWFAKNMHCRAVSSFEGFFLDSVFVIFISLLTVIDRTRLVTRAEVTIASVRARSQRDIMTDH